MTDWQSTLLGSVDWKQMEQILAPRDEMDEVMTVPMACGLRLYVR